MSKQPKYLIFDSSPIDKPRDYKAPFSDTFAWPRLAHLSWIVLDKDFKPLEDFDCIVQPEGWKFNKTISKRVKVDEEDVERKGAPLEDILKQFADSSDKVEFVIAHNLNINESVVGAEFIRKSMDNPMFRKERICLMQESTYYCKIPNRRGSYKWPSLTELHAICFKQRYSPANNARADVIAAARCFIKLMKIGQLADLFDEEE